MIKIINNNILSSIRLNIINLLIKGTLYKIQIINILNKFSCRLNIRYINNYNSLTSIFYITLKSISINQIVFKAINNTYSIFSL